MDFLTSGRTLSPDAKTLPAVSMSTISFSSLLTKFGSSWSRIVIPRMRMLAMARMKRVGDAMIEDSGMTVF